MELIRITKTVVATGDSLDELIKEAQTGDRISLYKGKIEAVAPHPEGFVIFQNNQILLNGIKLLISTNLYSIPDVHPQGFSFDWKEEIWLNGKVFYEGEYSDYCEHPEGFIIEKNSDELWLNGKELLYKGYWHDGYTWHPQGVIVDRDEELWLNGKEFLCKMDDCDNYQPCENGFVLERGDELLLNAKQLLYKGEWNFWEACKCGVIICKDNEVWLNDTDLLYKGNWSLCESHPYGLLITIPVNSDYDGEVELILVVIKPPAQK
jgi:hypothetical protein